MRLEFQRAFHKVPHQRLIAKAKGKGRGGNRGWLDQNQLKGRCETISTDENFSSWQKAVLGTVSRPL